jgi:hypothetical protein
MRSRGVVFGAIAALCLLLGGGWVLVASQRAGPSTSSARVAFAADRDAWVEATGASPLARRAPGAPRAVVVRAVDPSDSRLNGRVARVSLDDEGSATRIVGLACQRVHMAAGAGLCLALAPSGVDYVARFFDRRFRVRGEVALDGLPSRARVSANGRFGSITTFVAGHSYARAGEFSTNTTIVDMRRRKPLANLEQFEVFRDGERLDAPDFNFWGVTFAYDDDRFYATLATDGRRFLVEGSLRRRQMRVLRENVECPSLSPEGTRLAYKKRVGGEEDWRLHVLDLRTMRDVALAERRSIDDQAEWLDERTVLYGDEHDVWAVRADGTGHPRRLLRRAASPTRLE